MGMDDTIIDRIAFGGVKELEELYQQELSVFPIARSPNWKIGDV